jgi:hypothetical protein
MRGGNHGKVVVECSVDPLIVRALYMLRAAKEPDELEDIRIRIRDPRVRRFVAEMIETYIPPLFKKTFGITIYDFQRRWPAPAAKELPAIANQLLNDPNFYRPARQEVTA